MIIQFLYVNLKKNFAARKGLWGGGLHTWSYNTPKVYITRVGKISVDMFIVQPEDSIFSKSIW